jgi:hypothetical protein
MYAAVKGCFLNVRYMKKLICIILAVTAFISCGHETVVEKPDNLIEEEQMVNMLYDLSLLQASYSVLNMQDKRIDGLKFLKEKYGVDSTSFTNSNKYYASQPEKYQKMQKQVLERMGAEKAKLGKKAPTPAEKKLEQNRPTP